MPGQRREPPIVVRRDRAIAWVVLNRPDVLNALSFEMQEALPTLMEGLSRDKEVRVLVLTGAGDQAFCAGADVSEFKEKRATPERALRHLQLVQAAFTAVFDCPKVVIAMINGYAVGNGYMLAMFCDLRTAADTARIGITSSRLGSGGGSSGESRVRGALAPVLDSGAKPRRPGPLGHAGGAGGSRQRQACLAQRPPVSGCESAEHGACRRDRPGRAPGELHEGVGRGDRRQ